MRGFAVAIGAVALLACMAALASGDAGASNELLATPLHVEIVYPADGAAFRGGNITAVIEADGESVAFFTDDFTDGTLVNGSRDASGVVPNASAPTNESYYRSPEMELPRVAPTIEWSGSLEFLTSGSGGNLSHFFAIQVRFGDLTAGRNWSVWLEVGVDGNYLAGLGPTGDALRRMGCIQYQFLFLQPQNASNPHLSQMQVWFKGRIEKLEARLASDPAWTTVATSEGRYNVSLALPEGPSTIEARIFDSLGGTRITRVNVSRDNSAPAIASAPEDGAVIAEGQGVEIKFDGPIDQATVAGAVSVHADFPVDQVWTHDNTTLILSAQEAGRRGLVTVTIGPTLKDKAGNEFGRWANYTYEMGTKPPAQSNSAALGLALLGVVGLAAIGALYMAGRAQKQREAHADEVRAQMERDGQGPP